MKPKKLARQTFTLIVICCAVVGGIDYFADSCIDRVLMAFVAGIATCGAVTLGVMVMPEPFKKPHKRSAANEHGR